MTLLQEIQEAAINQSIDILTLLRKCRILAARLKNDEFKSWVQRELDGYPKDVAVPDYRKTAARSKGHFAGYAGSGMRNVEIPLSSIPAEFRKNFETVEFREGISPFIFHYFQRLRLWLISSVASRQNRKPDIRPG